MFVWETSEKLDLLRLSHRGSVFGEHACMLCVCSITECGPHFSLVLLWTRTGPLPDLSGFSLSLVMKGNSEPLESHNRNLVSTSSGQSGPNPSSFPMPSPVSQWEARARSHLERANQQEPHCRPCTHTTELHLHGCIWLPWCPSASVVLTNRDVVLSAYLTQSELWPPYRYVQVRTEMISDAPCALLHMN